MNSPELCCRYHSVVLQPAATSWRACVHDRDSFGLLCSQQIRPTTRSKRVRTRRWRTLVANLSTPDEERGMCCSLACRHFDRENERAVANSSTRLHSLHGNRQNTRVGMRHHLGGQLSHSASRAHNHKWAFRIPGSQYKRRKRCEQNAQRSIRELRS